MTEDNAGAVLARMGIDALAWSDEFAAIRDRRVAEDGVDLADDGGTMVGWFANALEAGRTAGRQETCPHVFEDLFTHGSLILCRKCGKSLPVGYVGIVPSP